MPKSAFPILVYGGASCDSSPSEAQSRKVVRLEEMKIVFVDLKWINAQGKVGSSPSEAQSRKVVHLEEMKIVFVDLKWIYAQGKGMILIGFLFYRSHAVC